jgi:large subunit ribosomal protein L13
MKTTMAKKGQVSRKWHLVDVSDKVLGRAAVEVAQILMGKHRPDYTPHVDTGDAVIVVNAAKMKVTGNRKPLQQVYQRYTRHPGGRRVIPLEVLMASQPDFVFHEAVRRMMPKSKLGRQMMKKLKIYAGGKHEHQAQQPQPLEI